VGLALVQAVGRNVDPLVNSLPFWVDFDVTFRTFVLAVSLAIGSAALAGIVPALKATGRRVQASIQRASADGTGIRFGRGYTVLIVSEVAVSVFLLMIGAGLFPLAVSEPGALGIPTDQYLYASVRIPEATFAGTLDATSNTAFGERVAFLHRELARRVAAEPGAGAVAVASALPGMSNSFPWMQIEGVAPEPDSPAPAHKVHEVHVDIGYFDALEQPILSGRGFNAGDLGEDRAAVIVNTSFVERVLGGRNPIGRRLRYWLPDQEPGPWEFEIVGVVGRLGMDAMKPESDQGIYRVLAPGELHPLTFAVRIGSEPHGFTPHLRSIVNAIDPDALIEDAVALSDVPNPERRIVTWGTYIVAALAAIAVVLSAACLYALMSFTVAERTRECGIRSALGAQPASIVAGIANRAFLQLAAGIAIGASLSALLLTEFDDLDGAAFRSTHWQLTLALIALSVLIIGMLACARPTLRALRIRPMDALKG
jgi:hypothetical protein